MNFTSFHMAFPEGLLVLIAAAGLLLLLARRINRELSSRFNTPLEADAVILRIEETGFYNGNSPRLKIQVHVMPGRGRNFVAELKETLLPSQMMQIKPGTRVRVLYHPQHPGQAKLIPEKS